ncbi:methyltransferase domain-containing protein [Candidatus Peregrinibacteria bacterium]|nr:methyltransferase domain-containing protein [Candidatus Peregrinibacteria bacterium]
MSILDFNLIDEITKRFKLDNEISIVDLGCGVGRSLWDLSNIFSKKEAELNLFGIFYSGKPDPNSLFFANQIRHEEAQKEPLLIAREFKIPFQNKTVPVLLNTNACKTLPMANNSIDLIYSTNAFHYFNDKIEAIKEISRILKINGIAIINIDRTDDDFWPTDLHFPRFRISKGSEIIDVKSLLEAKTGVSFTICINKVNSYGTGKNSYILRIEKHQKGVLLFPELSFDIKSSFSLEKIRCGSKNIEEIDEYKGLLADGIVFAKKASKENFGGYLSSYKLNE